MIKAKDNTNIVEYFNREIVYVKRENKKKTKCITIICVNLETIRITISVWYQTW